MMKYLLFILFLFTSVTFVYGQPGTTVDYEDNLGPLSLNIVDMFNGKYRYTENVSGDNITVYWSGTRWEIGPGPLFYSDVVTDMNPPNFTIGMWQDADPGDTAILLDIDGTGTTGTALPVELTRFEGIMRTSFAELEWATSSEAENKGFEIQRSRNGELFHTVGFVEGHGYSSSLIEYTFNDKTVRQGVDYYYRLKQINFSGRSENSALINLKALDAEHATLKLSPNPALEYVDVQFYSESNDNAQLSVFDAIGKLVISKTLSPDDKTNLQLDISELPGGNYFLKIEEPHAVEYKQFIKG